MPKDLDQYSYLRDLIHYLKTASDEERVRYAYWRKAQLNNRIDEERKDETYNNHHISVSDVVYANKTYEDSDIETEIASKDVDSWLQMIENKTLLTALRSLRPKELRFLFDYVISNQTHEDYAKQIGKTQQAVTARLTRILKKIKKFF